ncbi:VWA domain-containing protein [Ketobacter sp. MCCC 1A13808]|uniref:vWA domain-containing protein n=1 Tax=Ketobacter sp. MCCC 1A13808 TaxID=2602738 RepID=UPI0012EBD029|nr:VWA domain-containing protein [Ketobacter sp. MCCC 1A13808]MVF13273.1 VWA domain-containing protein [Ketobacter sp. MCCC 1A13808]
MDRILVDFVKALRGTGVRIATSETLDAIQVLDLIGYSNRTYLKLALANTLAKSEQEKQLFDTCFEQFFSFNDLSALEKQQPAANEDRSLLRSILSTSAEPEEPKSALGELLLSGDGQAIATAMAQAAAEAEVGNIRVITQKGLYGRRMMIGMGLESMEQEMWAAEASPEPAQQKLGAELRNARELLREEVKHYVERQYLLQAAGDGRALRESVMMETSLENLREFKDVQLLVRKLAKKLVATHSRRRRVFQRGKLNVRSTIRHNIPYSGVLLETHWKSKRVDRPKIMAICDVSGSVSQYARFLLMFLYSLTEVISNVRAFAFSNDLGEVTACFAQQNLDTAIATTLHQFGGGSTDYGRSLDTFSEQCLNQIDHRTTVIILGDGRTNYADPRVDIVQAIHKRSRQLIWLNPENKRRWGSGDSEMDRYQAYCTRVESCQSLHQLERFISNLLRYGQ